MWGFVVHKHIVRGFSRVAPVSSIFFIPLILSSFRPESELPKHHTQIKLIRSIVITIVNTLIATVNFSDLTLPKISQRKIFSSGLLILYTYTYFTYLVRG